MKANMLILILLLSITVTDAAGEIDLTRGEKEYVRSNRAVSLVTDSAMISFSSFKGNEQFGFPLDFNGLIEEKKRFETNLVPDIWVNNLGKLKKSEIEPILIKLDCMTNEIL